MYTADQAAHSALRSASRPTSAPTTNARRRTGRATIEHVWKRLTGIYADQFTRKYGENPHADAAVDWAEGLADLTQAQIDKGIDACRVRDSAWVPNLPEFRGLCFGGDTRTEAVESPEQIAARLLARDQSDLAHFRESNKLWRANGHTDDLFDLSRCFNFAQSRALGIA